MICFVLFAVFTPFANRGEHTTPNQVKVEPVSAESGNKLFVGKLGPNVDDAGLAALFAPFGRVQHANIIRHV